jgi:phosphoglycerol transferase MdoB-like AlkP superfamily enzyme
MKINYLVTQGKVLWQNNRPFTVFILLLLAILSALKIIFYNYNYSILFAGSDKAGSLPDKPGMIMWSVFYDLLTVILINFPLLLLLQFSGFVGRRIISIIILPIFILLNTSLVLLNVLDIFYYRFHFQRAGADLLFVLDHPFKQIFRLGILATGMFMLLIAATVFIIWKMHKNLFKSFCNGHNSKLTAIIVLAAIIPALVYKKKIARFFLPSYPLVSISSQQLPAVQNSFHTFVYSLFRKGQDVPLKDYMTFSECDSLYPLKKAVKINRIDTGRRNIVLFIMESVPREFFDSNSKYKVAMPFFDSLLQKSTFYSNGFCYTFESNKGITAVLGGLPTLTEIPLYHSQFVNMPISAVGSILKKRGYHSFFCIGDDYDNFGFAKCTRWLGIEKYYCKDDMEYNNVPLHTMGMHDEYALNFFHKKISLSEEPFFATNYNISTHFPYDLPASFNKKFDSGYTAPMKAMSYYDFCLQKFFKQSEKEEWFRNTVFIFCSDHWGMPDINNFVYHNVNSFRIPVVIFDPAKNSKKINTSMVSQFDVMGTVLGISGYRDSVISYGGNLLDSAATTNNKAVFSRASNALYQVIDSAYVLGYNIVSEKTEYLFSYKTDTALKINLISSPAAVKIREKLLIDIKAFIQKATMQYNNKPFK